MVRVSTQPAFKTPSVEAVEGADESKELHQYSDVDSQPNAQHHTLGPGPTQAAPGTHDHDDDYAAKKHTHKANDLPEVVIPDEIIVSPTDPLLTDPDLEDGTVWIDSSVPDAVPQVISGVWEQDPFNITSTTFAHPNKWGNPIFVAPCDGVLIAMCNVDIDATGLLNNREAQWRGRIYDSSNTVVNGRTVRDDRTRVYTLDNQWSAPVVAGESYSVKYEFALSHANGTTFTVLRPKITLVFLPRAQWAEYTIETDP